MTTRMYPIQGGQSVPWDVMIPFESRCQKNHSQSINRIAERGGFGPAEAWAIVNNLDWREVEKIGFAEAERKWQEFAARINQHYAELEALQKENERLRPIAQQVCNVHTDKDIEAINTCPVCLWHIHKQQCQERDKLQKENAELNKALALKLDALPSGLTAGQSVKLERELASLRAENAELKRDKERLDWLEQTCPGLLNPKCASLRETIDSAMKATASNSDDPAVKK